MLWSSLGSLGYSLHSSIHPIAGTPTTLKPWRLNHYTLQLILYEIHLPSYVQACAHVCTHTLFVSKSNMFSNLFSLHHPTNIIIAGKIYITGVAELALVFAAAETFWAPFAYHYCSLWRISGINIYTFLIVKRPSSTMGNKEYFKSHWKV